MARMSRPYRFITIQINAELLLTTEHRDEQYAWMSRARAREPQRRGCFERSRDLHINGE